jgi:uncharacterized protein (DUF362 family)
MMDRRNSRRSFLGQVAAVAAGAAVRPGLLMAGEPEAAVQPPSTRPAGGARVIIARDEALTKGKVSEHGELLRKMLDASMQRLTGAADAAAAWRKLFKAQDRVGIKVNTLGFATQPAVVEAIVAGLRQAGVAAEKIIIWDRFDRELAAAGYKIAKAAGGVQIRGTAEDNYESGYQEKTETSGKIASRFSNILAEQVDALISVPVLKDHALAGATLGMKNFFGAIHNPREYHGEQCNPYIVDVVSHPIIRSKWRLTICDGTRAQYDKGPTRHPGFEWRYGGLLVGTDFVAVDAVGADLVDGQRKAKGLKTVAEVGRPYTYITTAAERGLGEGDLSRIERVEV